MAVRHGYGKVAGADALVFAYDTGDTSNSYRGEPTTNLTTDTPSGNGWAGAFTVVDSATKTYTIESRQNNAATTSAWRTHYWSVSSYIGSYVTISADVEFVSETDCTFRDLSIGQGNTGSFPYHIAGSDVADRVKITTKPISKIHLTWSGVINSTGIVGFTQWINNVTANGANSVLKISNVQIEAKAHETPFTSGTRSVSGSLLDLTGNNNITAASNEGYDSNAQIVYDGTDDRIITQDPQFFNNNSGDTSFSNGASYEFVVKAYGTGYFVGVGSAWRISAGSTSFIFWDRDISAGTSVTTTGIGNLSVTNNYVHVVGVLDPINNEKRFYINGEEELNISYDRTPSMGTTQLALGKSYPNSSDYCNCELPVGKVYTKALTAAEVQSNYRHYKNRFGI
jgi:hypothetical protein